MDNTVGFVQGVYFFVAGVWPIISINTFQEEFSKQSILHANAKLKDTDYGTREFGIIDIYGVLITFYERMSNAD